MTKCQGWQAGMRGCNLTIQEMLFPGHAAFKEDLFIMLRDICPQCRGRLVYNVEEDLSTNQGWYVQRNIVYNLVLHKTCAWLLHIFTWCNFLKPPTLQRAELILKPTILYGESGRLSSIHQFAVNYVLLLAMVQRIHVQVSVFMLISPLYIIINIGLSF